MGLSIERDKVIKGFELCHTPGMNCKYCPYNSLPDNENCSDTLVRDVIAMLKEQESEAKWIYGEDKTGVDGWYCSECDFFEPWFYEFTDDIDFIRFYGHCPSCGRKMTSYTGTPTKTGG